LCPYPMEQYVPKWGSRTAEDELAIATFLYR